jgi:hypothetical protein
MMAINTSRPDGAVRLSDLDVTTRELHPNYKLEQHEAIRGSTGYLPVFSLVPNDPQNPTFAARVDDGVRNRRRTPELDIDIKGVNSEIERDFKACRNGYSGHHRDQSPNQTERVFEVDRAGPGCLNRFPASISGASAGIRPPRGAAEG